MKYVNEFLKFGISEKNSYFFAFDSNSLVVNVKFMFIVVTEILTLFLNSDFFSIRTFFLKPALIIRLNKSLLLFGLFGVNLFNEYGVAFRSQVSLIGQKFPAQSFIVQF
jgi:hypothetical protein